MALTNATRRLGAPADWNHAKQGICHTIEIRDEGGWMMSAWRLESAELRRLREGAAVFLSIKGEAHPVVALQVGPDPVAAAPDKAEIEDIVFRAVARALGHGAPGLAETSCFAIAAAAARRASHVLEARLAGLPLDSSGT